MKEKIIFVAAECAPFAKVGGLADVVGSLPKALKKIGVNISVVIPFYDIIKIKKDNLILLKSKVTIAFEEKKEFFDVWKTKLPQSEVPLFLIAHKKFFKGSVYIESDASSGGSDQEARRFLFFSAAALKVAELIRCNIIHCHDWHSALIPFLLPKKKIKTLLTIHNIAYQGVFAAELVNRLLKTKLTGTINCLEKGVESANIITTVSPTYAKEILSSEFGFGLEKLLKKRKKDLFGIINGLDEQQFSPITDSYIQKKYSIDTLADKIINKEYLQKKYFQKVDAKIPVIGMVTRIAEQKGFDLIEKIMPQIIKENLQIIILGQGMKRSENFLKITAKKNPQKLSVITKFDERLAHQIYAGSDIFLMPSAFEPCGLGQMIAMKYGTIPIVRAIGGLKDTVRSVNKNKPTGFSFEKYSAKALWLEIKKALRIFKNKKKWQEIQKNGMSQDFSWKRSAQSYLRLYQK